MIPPPPPLVITVDEAAERLGVSRSTMYRLIADGEIPVVKLRDLTRVRESDLVDYVATQSAKRPRRAS